MEIVGMVLLVMAVPLITAIVAFLTDRETAAPVPRISPENSDSPGRALFITGLIWTALTVAGVFAVVNYDFYPTVGSDKGEEIAHAFTILTVLAVPVAATVLAVLIYSVLRRATVEEPRSDGPSYQGEGPFSRGWVLVTTALTILIIIYPGLTALEKVIDNPSQPDLVVRVEGVQWTWFANYPEHDVSMQRELVFPVGRTVRFEITSRDVLHSFWVPSLLMKIDAIPGQVTVISLVATETGDYNSNPLVRLQCTELCGTGHSSMWIPVRVVSESEFKEWVADKSGAPSSAVVR